MKKLFSRFVSDQKGLTLVSLIVTVSIIATLSAGITTATYGSRQQAGGSAEVIHPAPPETIEALDTSADISGTEGLASPADLPDVQVQAELAARQMELRIVQTAVDIMMIRQGLSSVAETPGTNDMSAFPTGSPLYPGYLHDPQSHYFYSCDSFGQVSLAN